jgi:hypothetical protein
VSERKERCRNGKPRMEFAEEMKNVVRAIQSLSTVFLSSLQCTQRWRNQTYGKSARRNCCELALVCFFSYTKTS